MNDARSFRHAIGLAIMTIALVFLSIGLGRYSSRAHADMLGVGLYALSIALILLVMFFMLRAWMRGVK